MGRTAAADFIRERRAEAVARGDCMVCCCRAARPGVKTCGECASLNQELVAERYHRLRATGCCTRCATPSDGYALCEACAERVNALARAARARRIAEGREPPRRKRTRKRARKRAG